MAGILHIAEAVVTEEVLRRHHGAQTEVDVAAGAVVTPTGWDYLRNHRLRLRHAGEAAPGPGPATGAAGPASGAATRDAAGPVAGAIPEVLPPGSEAGVLSRGRYEHLDRSYGCRTEEFGSGFVEPAAAGQGQAGLAGGGAELEALVQRLTDQVMARLAGG